MLVLAYRDHVILLQRGQPGMPVSRWEVPSGRVEVGEDALSAAIRVGDELVGVRLDRVDLNLAGLVHCRYPQQVGRLGLFFTATYFTNRHASPRSMRPEDWTGIEWAPLASPPTGPAAYHAAGLDLVRSGEGYGALGGAVAMGLCQITSQHPTTLPLGAGGRPSPPVAGREGPWAGFRPVFTLPDRRDPRGQRARPAPRAGAPVRPRQHGPIVRRREPCSS